MELDEKTIIRSLFDPTIPIDKMEIRDVSTKTGDEYSPDVKGTETGWKVENLLGQDYPFIIINDYHFDEREILYFEINESDFLPTCTFIFSLVKSDVFSSKSMPKDGDILSVFIRAKNDAFKPIRNDYLILTCDAGEGGLENLGREITITGELFIPRIHDQKIASKKGTSFSVLKEIAKELGLGFATNESDTNDFQEWVCPNESYKQWIEKIAKHSWKNTESFYKVFIDVYYHLNFVNVNNQLIGQEIVASQIIDIPGIKNYWLDQKNDSQDNQQVSTKMLTNIDGFSPTNMFIKGYKTINNSSSINKIWGYKKLIQFFDLKSKKYWELFIEPIVTKGAEREKIILKGRIKTNKSDNNPKTYEEDLWKTQNISEWKGIQSKNVHSNWFYAEEYNARNLAELEKMYLEVRINRWNPNIFMYEKLPVLFMNSEIDYTKNTSDTSAEDEEIIGNETFRLPSIDQFNSGFYVVFGKRILYEKNNSQFDPYPSGTKYSGPMFSEVIMLTRREWNIP
jgi:hypothetical protein